MTQAQEVEIECKNRAFYNQLELAHCCAVLCNMSKLVSIRVAAKALGVSAST
ncbi:hypothetical protein ABIB38_003575, partial [Massilia sp. UYP11]